MLGEFEDSPQCTKTVRKFNSKHPHVHGVISLDRPRRCHSCCCLTMNGFHTSQTLSTVQGSKGRAFWLAFPHTLCFVPYSALPVRCRECCDCHPGTQGFNRFGAGAVHLGYHQLDILRFDALLIHLALLQPGGRLGMRSALGYTPGHSHIGYDTDVNRTRCSMVQQGAAAENVAVLDLFDLWLFRFLRIRPQSM